MKTKSKDEMADELRPEYDLRQLLKSGVQGKYAARFREGTNLVLLEPEVAKAFPNDSAVNERCDWCFNYPAFRPKARNHHKIAYHKSARLITAASPACRRQTA